MSRPDRLVPGRCQPLALSPTTVTAGDVRYGVMTPHERVGQLLERWESVDGDDDARWRRARRSVAVAFILEQLGVPEPSLDPDTTGYLQWLAAWDAATIVDTISYIEFLAGRHGAMIGEAPTYLEWLSRWDAPEVAATVRLARLTREADPRTADGPG